MKIACLSLIEERRSVLNKRLLKLVRQLSPRTRPERHGLHELLGGTGMVSGGNLLDYGTDLQH
jgi:hypothetical protein